MRLSSLFTFSMLLIGSAVAASAAGPVITIDENGNGTVNGATLPYTLGTDPTPGAPAVTKLLTYSPLPFNGVAGDVKILASVPPIPIPIPIVVIRFTGNNTILVYAGPNLGQNGNSLATQYMSATPGQPQPSPNGVTNTVAPNFSGSIMTYTPTSGQPGYDSTNPTYVFLFPTTQAPSNILNPSGSNLKSAFQLSYATHFDVGDAILNFTNGGSSAAGTIPVNGNNVAGAICLNVYVYQPNNQLATCCSCAVAPNGLYSWPVSYGSGNLLSHVSPTPTSVVIKLVATTPAASSTPNNPVCDATFQNAPFSLAPGLSAWGTRSHITNTGTVAITETPYEQKALSTGEASKLQTDCKALGSSSQCPACYNGGLAQPALTPSF